MVLNINFLHIWTEEIHKNSQEISGPLIIRVVFHLAVVNLRFNMFKAKIDLFVISLAFNSRMAEAVT